jgi:hypothetical protein
MEGSRLWPLDAAFRNHTKAFSSEVDTGSREENASKKYLEHDPEKCVAVFRKDHAQTKR